MFKLPIAFENIDGETTVEEHYFNISLSEATDLATEEGDNSFFALLQRVTAGATGANIIKGLKEIVRRSYGIRNDKNQFRKDEYATDDFMQSEAYDALFTRMITEPAFAAEFVNGIFPKDLLDKVGKMTGSTPTSEPAVIERDIESYSQKEFMQMPAEEFDALRKKYKTNAPPAMMMAAFNRL